MLLELSQIIGWLLKYKYFILFPFAVLEGPIVTVIAGYLSSMNLLNFWIVYGVVVLGDTVGDILYFAAGKWGRMKFCRRWGRFLDMRIERVERLEKYFAKHAGKTLFWGKFGYGVVGTLMFAAGIADVSFMRFLGFTFIATLIKSMILVQIGFYFGYAYEQIKIYLDYTSYITIALAILLILIYIYFQRRAKNILENNNKK